jgi:hypothetical protein
MQIKNAADLRVAILEIEKRKQQEKNQLAEKFTAFKESLTPLNLIKSTFKGAKESPGLTGNILKAGIGLGVGILSQQLLVGKSAGVAKKLLGTALKMGVAGAVANNTGTLKTAGVNLLKNLFRSKKKDAVI